MPDNKHYMRRIPPQHKRPKFRRWLETNLQPLHDAELMVKSLDDAFDLDQSQGVQMETTGAIVGRDRVLSFDPECGASPVLTDDMYRLLQRAKISLNHWDGTIPGALKLWENLFPMYELIIQDNQDMTMDLVVIGRLDPLESELMYRGYIAPKPMGVRVRYTFVFIAETMYRQLYIGGVTAQRIAETTLIERLRCFKKMLHTGGATVQQIAETGLNDSVINFSGTADIGGVTVQTILGSEVPEPVPVPVDFTGGNHVEGAAVQTIAASEISESERELVLIDGAAHIRGSVTQCVSESDPPVNDEVMTFEKVQGLGSFLFTATADELTLPDPPDISFGKERQAGGAMPLCISESGLQVHEAAAVKLRHRKRIGGVITSCMTTYLNYCRSPPPAGRQAVFARFDTGILG